MGYPRVRGWVGRVIVVKRTLPELLEVCAKFGGDWSSSLHVKEGHLHKQTVCFYIFRR